jgi:hypothetical protein
MAPPGSADRRGDDRLRRRERDHAGVGEILHVATIANVGEVSLETLWHAGPAFPSVSEV